MAAPRRTARASTTSGRRTRGKPLRKLKLPGEGIEVPAIEAPAGAAPPGHVNCDGRKKRPSRTARRQKNNDGRPKHQNDVKRQDVGIVGLIEERGGVDEG